MDPKFEVLAIKNSSLPSGYWSMEIALLDPTRKNILYYVENGPNRDVCDSDLYSQRKLSANKYADVDFSAFAGADLNLDKIDEYAEAAQHLLKL